MKLTGRKIKIPFQAEFPLLFIILYLPAYLNQSGPLSNRYFDSPYIQLQMILMSLVYSLFILYLMENVASELPGELISCLKPPGLKSSAVLLGGLFCLYFLVSLLNLVYPPPENPVLLTRGYMLIPTLFTCLFSAAQEEIFFRYYGYARLRQNGTDGFRAMILMSLIFAAGHAYEGLHGLIFSFISAVFLSLAIQRGVSLFSLIAAHGVFNFLIILINYLSGGYYP